MTTTPPKLHPFEATALAVLFAAAISLPLVKQLIVKEPDTSTMEKRLLAREPDFFSGNWKWRVKYLPGACDAWYSDHFGFRYQLLEADSLVSFKLLVISQWVVIGNNGWLYYKMTPPLFTQSLSEADLAQWRSYLERRQAWLAARGIKYLFVVAPDKDSVYPEFLPYVSRPPPRELPVDQLVRYLRETHSSVDILSLREPLIAAKTREREPLYYKQDGHWNSLGAWYGYEAIIRNLAKWFPALNPKPRADYRLAFAPDDSRDIGMQAALFDYGAPVGPVLQPLAPLAAQKQPLAFPGLPRPSFMTKLPNPGNLPSAIMIRDSFTTSLAPYLSESFSRISYLWPGFDSMKNEKTIAGAILDEKPDVFIEERIQRFLITVPDDKVVFGGDAPP
jgi:alginate O-acetyltransferase complex protein AlgJ